MCGDEEDLIFDVRMSNCLFESMMQAEFSVVFFSIFGLLLNMVLFEVKTRTENADEYEDKITV